MSSHRILGDKTLKEAFSRVTPEIRHLRIFGCPVYIHVHVEKRTNLDPLGQKRIFVGYNETSKAYKIFIPAQWKTIVRKYINFKENLASKKSQDSSAMTKDEEQHALKDEK
jgi:NADH:ubiquinone oxidoreductase subunit